MLRFCAFCCHVCNFHSRGDTPSKTRKELCEPSSQVALDSTVPFLLSIQAFPPAQRLFPLKVSFFLQAFSPNKLFPQTSFSPRVSGFSPKLFPPIFPQAKGFSLNFFPQTKVFPRFPQNGFFPSFPPEFNLCFPVRLGFVFIGKSVYL